ncbi:hypothetical protein OG730_21615 [Streptomyces sp. NBC_01298]|uniref:hypothetical protein n=1 Tax=Streptomyces sp. NBC_01298 TaxID=2903817 RepID=UPI002E12AF90|nr:hypothetical protein OG730_21615 [Streptomyces sp. NBC_01298]
MVVSGRWKDLLAGSAGVRAAGSVPVPTTSLGGDVLIPSARTRDCDACGGPHAKWVPSLTMALCSVCEREGTHHPEREPVLVGEVLRVLLFTP